VKKSVLMTSLCLGVITSGAFAADVAIRGNVSETVDASNNYFLAKSPSGYTARSLSAGTVDFLAKTSDTQYLLDANYSYYKYFGPGAVDTTLTWGTPASATFHIDHTTELTKYNIAASWNRADEATTQLAQSGVATLHGTINTYKFSGGLTHELSRIDAISWAANATTVSYTDPTQTPYVDVTTVVGWNHALSQTTALNNSVSFDWFSEDNPAKSQRLFWKLTSGLTTRLSSRLTFNGEVGIGFVNSYQSGIPQSVALPGVFQPQVGSGNSWLADAGLTYALLKTTSVSLTAAQSISPLFTGQLQKSDTLGLTLNHQINNASNLSLSTQFSYLPATSGSIFGQTSASDFFTASFGYRYQLTRDWRTNVSYTYLQRNDDTGLTRASVISFSLNYDFNVLGNPSAFNKADQERARQRARQSVGQVFPTFVQ
jgi:hypothetical protein